MTSARVVTLLVLGLAASLSAAEVVVISNTEPRTDVDGALMDIHDGNIVQWEAGGLWYWYGMSYTDCPLETGRVPPQDCPGIYRKYTGFPEGAGCGFREDHDVSVFTSPNLVDWTRVGSALPVDGPRPVGVYFRPKVIRHPTSGEYVLWVNYLPAVGRPLSAYTNTTYLVATSPNATGPFQVVTPAAALAASGPGDAAMLVTESGEGYIAFDAWGNDHSVLVQKLTDDFHDATDNHTAALSPSDNEAPLFFARRGTFYITWGHTCCFCRGGGGAEVWTAPHPLGPWTSNSDLNPGTANVVTSNFTIPAQSSFVIEVPEASGSTAYVYVGDLWTSAPDGLKSHDLQYWQPIEFDDSVSPATVSPLQWTDNITLELA